MILRLVLALSRSALCTSWLICVDFWKQLRMDTRTQSWVKVLSGYTKQRRRSSRIVSLALIFSNRRSRSAGLRLWLSLIVDYDLGLDPFTAEKSQFSGAIEHISQLPNLEMNFRRADSLHDHISGVPVVILPQRASRHAR